MLYTILWSSSNDNFISYFILPFHSLVLVDFVLFIPEIKMSDLKLDHRSVMKFLTKLDR